MRRAKNQMPSAEAMAQARPIHKFFAASKSGAAIVVAIRIEVARTTGATSATGGRSKNRFSSPYALACTNALPMSALKLSNKIATPMPAEIMCCVCVVSKTAIIRVAAITGAVTRVTVSVIGCKKNTENVQADQITHARRVATNCTLVDRFSTRLPMPAPMKGKMPTVARSNQMNDLFATS